MARDAEAAPPGGARRPVWMSVGHAGREVDELRPSARRLLRPAAPAPAALAGIIALGVVSVGAQRRSGRRSSATPPT